MTKQLLQWNDVKISIPEADTLVLGAFIDRERPFVDLCWMYTDTTWNIQPNPNYWMYLPKLPVKDK